MITWIPKCLLVLLVLFSSNLMAIDNLELARLQKFISETRVKESSTKDIQDLMYKRKVRLTQRHSGNKDFSHDQAFFGIVGDSEVIRINFPSSSCDSNPSSTVTLTGAAEHVLVSTTCNVGTCNCSADVQFSPTQSGVTHSNFCVQTSLDTQCANFYGYGFTYTELMEAQTLACGSIINVDAKTVAERIPVLGTPFDLYYSSLSAERYSAPYPRPVRSPSFNPENLSVSIINYYDSANNRLFKGDGTSVIRNKSLDLSGNSVVVDNEDVQVFDTAGKHLFTKSLLTGQIKFSFDYDSSNKIIKVSDSYGKETIFARDTNGVLQSITSPFGDVTSFTVNAKGNINQIINPANEIFSLNYNSAGNLNRFVKPDGNETTFNYTPNGWLYRDTGAGGNFWDLSFSTDGDDFITDQVSAMERYHTYITRKNPSNNRKERQYFGPAGFEKFYSEGDDKSTYYEDIYETSATLTTPDERFGNLLDRVSSESKTINGLTRETVYSQAVTLSDPTDYFSYNQITNTTTVNGKQSTQVFDKTLLTHTYTNEMGVQQTVEIDSHERPVKIQHGSDVPLYISYNSLGQILETTQNGTNTTKYTHNSKGLVSSIKNALNETTRFSYNNAGRMTRVTLPDGRFTRYVYNKNGQILRVFPSGRPAHSFVYNLMELPSVYRPPLIADSPVVQTRYSYDQDKNLILIKRPDGKKVRFNYEPEMGQLMAMVLGQNERQTYSYYELTDNVRAINSPDQVRNSFTYFGKDQIASELQTIDNTSSRVTFAFDNFFRQSRRIIQVNGTEVSRIAKIYNDDNQPRRVGEMTFTYDPTSGRVVSTILDKIRDRKTYDAFGNLATYRASYYPEGLPVQELYFYTLTRDALHRIIAKTERVQGVRTDYAYSYDSAGRLSSVSKNGVITSSFVYDLNSNRVSGIQDGQPFTATFDDQDRMLTYDLGSEDQKQFTYNANGELTQIVQGSLATTFVPDTLGRIKFITLPSSDVVSYKLDWDGRRSVKAINGTSVKRSIFETKFQLAGELDSANNFTEYVSATHVNSSDYFKKNGEHYRIIKDHLGSPRLVVKASDAAVLQRMDYNEWGKVVNDTNPGVQPFGFAGGMYDHDTKLVKFGARDYDASIGRWLSKDPILFAGGDTNLYGYVLQDPINLIDPDGKSPLAVLLGPVVAFEAGYAAGTIGYEMLANRKDFNTAFNLYWDRSPMNNLFDWGTGTLLGHKGSMFQFFGNPDTNNTINQMQNRQKNLDRQMKNNSCE